MNRISTALLCLFLLVAGPVAAAGAQVKLQGLRAWPAPDYTRVVLDLSGGVSYRMQQSPGRIVIEIDRASVASTTALNLANTPIRRYYAGGAGPGKINVVFELKQPVRAKSFLLKPNERYGHRLVLDLYLQSGPEMVADAPAPRPAAASRPLAATPARPARPAAAAPPPRPRAELAEPRVEPAPKRGRKGKGRDIIVAIDAGHGGEDPGALGPGGLREKDINLAIAREVARLINAEPGYRAELVRSGDYFIPLKKRREIARGRRADFFVSVHADSAPSKGARGSSVYALSLKGATSVQARTIAQRENDADLMGGVDISDKDDVLAGVLVDLQMTGTLDASLRAGAMVLTELRQINTLHSRKVEQAGFAVLKSVDIPSLLVETGFISNEQEARKLASSSHQRQVAKAISGGIHRYFLKSPPPGTYLALKQQSGAALAGLDGETARD